MVADSSPRRRPAVLGVDIGGVLIQRSADDEDTSFFGAHPMDTPAVEGAFEALARLASGPFAYRVHLVSKAGPSVTERTQAWLAHQEFTAVTGIAPTQVHFVRHRADKAAVCTKLGVTHFVDDRLSVLNLLPDVSRRYLFTGGLGSSDAPVHRDLADGIVRVDTWPELVEALTRSL
jgi:hypothetical protein